MHEVQLRELKDLHETKIVDLEGVRANLESKHAE